jgi:hypothetical protein
MDLRTFILRYRLTLTSIVVCSVLTSGCLLSSTTPSTSDLTTTPLPVSPTSSTADPATELRLPDIPLTSSPTPPHPTRMPTPIADLNSLRQALPQYGTLYYLKEKQVWKGIGLSEDQRLAALPFKEIEAVQLVNDDLWLLADGQFAVVNLASGTVRSVCEVPRPDVSATLLPLPERRIAVYTVRVENGSTLGWKSSVGICDLQTEQARPLVELPRSVRPLGLTPDGQALYATQTGGDGGGTLVTLDLDDGTIGKTDSFVCLLSFALAPDRSWLAFAEPEARLIIYDLSTNDLSPMMIDLPQQPSRADQLMAGQDRRYLYFTLLPGRSGSDPARTHGWWRADVSTGALEQLRTTFPVGPDEEHLSTVAVSPTGRALLLRGATGYSLLDLESEVRLSLTLSLETQILDWCQP